MYRPHIAEMRRQVIGPNFNGIVLAVPERFSCEPMLAATRESQGQQMTEPMKWTAAITDEGDLHSAFVEGHVPLDSLPNAAEQIFKAFDDIATDIGEMVSESFDGEPIHKQLMHFWLRPEQTEDGEKWFFAREGDAGAMPVTGVRFM
jgi:hypothetical protein